MIVSKLLTRRALKLALEIQDHRLRHQANCEALQKEFRRKAKALGAVAEASGKILWQALYVAADVSPNGEYKIELAHYKDCGHAYLVEHGGESDNESLSEMLRTFGQQSNETIN